MRAALWYTELTSPPLFTAKTIKIIPTASWETVIIANPVEIGTFSPVMAYIL
jgi:hypothetical protein